MNKSVRFLGVAQLLYNFVIFTLEGMEAVLKIRLLKCPFLKGVNKSNWSI
jgi:hypothetical protein